MFSWGICDIDLSAPSTSSSRYWIHQQQWFSIASLFMQRLVRIQSALSVQELSLMTGAFNIQYLTLQLHRTSKITVKTVWTCHHIQYIFYIFKRGKFFCQWLCMHFIFTCKKLPGTWNLQTVLCITKLKSIFRTDANTPVAFISYNSSKATGNYGLFVVTTSVTTNWRGKAMDVESFKAQYDINWTEFWNILVNLIHSQQRRLFL